MTKNVFDVFHSKRIREVEVLENFLAKQPNDAAMKTSQQLLANYVECSGINEGNEECLDYLVCLYTNPNSIVNAGKEMTYMAKPERDVISM